MICHTQNTHTPSHPLPFSHNQQKCIVADGRDFTVVTGAMPALQARRERGSASGRTATATYPGRRCGTDLRPLAAVAGRVPDCDPPLPRHCCLSLCGAGFRWFGSIYSHKRAAVIATRSHITAVVEFLVTA